MSETKLISPLLDNFDMGEPISDHNGVRCCPAMKKDADDRYIVKIISVPASQVRLDALLLSGAFADENAALAYFKEVADGIVEEAQALQRLSEQEGFSPIIDWQIVPMDEGVGYEVYLLSPYQKTLEKHFRRSPMTHLSAVNLGLDICAALSTCRRCGYLYVDLRPSNIYLNDQMQYRIGDIGLVKIDRLKFTSLSDRYRSEYTAPEIADAFAALNETVDIYAAGLILYQAYNDGLLPFRDDVKIGDALPAPAYADYEMSEIILKACAPNPEDRWQDPVEMGQAIASYMQRNGANDTPIVPEPIIPEPIEEPIAPADTETEEQETDVQEETAPLQDVEAYVQEPVYAEDELGNLNFLEQAQEDETLPDEDSDIAYEEVSNEVSDILNQADDLISHPTPEGVVQPEPIAVELPPMPEPEPESEEVPEEVIHVEAEEAESIAEEETIETEEPSESDETAIGEAAEEAFDDEDIDAIDAQLLPRRKRHVARWIIASISIILVAALLAFGIFYYKNHYIKTIDAMVLNGNKDTLTVSLTTQADESLLSVVCADAYGNILEQPVVDGKAVFTGLAPNSAYTVTVMIDGFHSLSGETTGSYATPAQTNIAQFSALCGAEDASVKLDFTVTGEDPENWTVAYFADGEEEKTAVITGHTITLSDLTLGKEYTFRLNAEGAKYVTGTQEIKYTVSKVIRPENLQAVSFVDNKLTVTWSTSADVTAQGWIVRCYNDSGFDKMIEVTEPTAVFDELDPTIPYAIEVAAFGMSESETVDVKANSVTVTDFSVDASGSNLKISWNCGANVPKDGWILQYTVDGSVTKSVASEDGTTVDIFPVVPGGNYQFILLIADNTGVLGGKHTYTAKAAGTFEGFYITAADMEFQMCLTPSVPNWDVYDLDDDDFTTNFKIGQKASFYVKLGPYYNEFATDEIVTVFVIRDEQGKVASLSSQTETWRRMWNYYRCELDIPEIPSIAGNYSVSVYFNGDLVNEQDFTVTE